MAHTVGFAGQESFFLGMSRDRAHKLLERLQRAGQGTRYLEDLGIVNKPLGKEGCKVDLWLR